MRSHWIALGASALLTLNAVAQTLPAPPVSPAPVVNYEYDANGNLTKTIAAPGGAGFAFPTTNTYDALNRLKDSTDAKNGKTQFGYNGREDVIQVTDPRNLVTQYPRNGLGDATSLVSPDTGTATKTYDAAGNLKTVTDSRGVLATYSYDVLNRLTSIVYSQTGQTSITQTFTYDQTGTGYANGIGRLTSTNTPVSSTQYTYDAQGRLLTDIQRIKAATGANSSQVTRTVTYGYDTAGNITSIVYPSGRKLAITYTDGVPSAMTLAPTATGTPVNLITGIQWEPFGGVKSWNWQMGVSTQLHERVYDSSGRLVRYRIGDHIRDVTYDAGDRITGYTHYLASTGAAVPTLNQTFGYDELGRLTSVVAGSSSWTIGYDANGNRNAFTLNATPSTYTVSTTSNRLASTTNPARTFAYDNAGNITGDTAFTATYNLAGRMATLVKAGVTTTYAVDGFGRRVRKFASSGASSTILFVYDQQGQLLGEYNSSGTALREYVWLGNIPVAVFTPNGTNPPLVYYIHTDHLNTPRVVVNTSGQQRWNWLAEPFGTTAPNTNPQSLGAFTFNLRFPGQYADSESGLFYNYFRDYDAASGRYIQSDPIGLQGGINTYAYVGGSPTASIDSLGLAGERTNAQPAPQFNAAYGNGLSIQLLLQQIRQRDPGYQYPAVAQPSYSQSGASTAEVIYLQRVLDGYIRFQPRTWASCTPTNPSGGVYTLNTRSGECLYCGRSNDLFRRESEWARDPVRGSLVFKELYRTDSYSQQRGLEQLVYEMLNPPLNAVRPISQTNPRLDFYRDAARVMMSPP